MRRTLWTLILVLFATAVPVRAAGVRVEQPLDSFEKLRPGATIPVAPVRRDWNEIEKNHPTWKVWVDERTGMPTLASGRGIEWFTPEAFESVTLDAIELRARRFLAKTGALPAGADVVRDDDASAQLRADQWRIVLRLEVDGVRVENARLDLALHHGKLVQFGTSHWAAPSISGVPQLDASAARAILDGYLGGAIAHLTVESEPRLTIAAVSGDGLEHRLLWRFNFREPNGPEEWTGEVDAHTGAVDSFYEATHYAGVKGGVFPEQPDGVCSDGGCELDYFPMPFADWSETGGGSGSTDSYGNFDCGDPEATFQTELAGDYVVVNDSCGPVLETAGCSGDLQLGVKVGDDCTVGPTDSPGNTSATRTAYYHANRVAEVARFHNPGMAWLQGSVELNTNWAAGTCNASYGGGAIYVYISGMTCTNSGENETVVTHEWGHGLDDNDGGSWDATSEAYADMVAMFASRQSCFAKGLFRTLTCTGYGDACLTCDGFRDHDWAKRTLNTPATPQGFVQDYCNPGGSAQSPCGGSVHCESYPIDEAMWDLVNRDLPAAGVDQDTAWHLVERLWYSSRAGSGGDIYNCALPSSDSCGSGTWYEQLRLADDDDADLSNGTPHAAAIFAAFDRHNIACGALSDATNQSTTSCPSLATPALSLSVLQSGTELTWPSVPGASEYVVFRGDLGCQRGQVPAAVVTSTGWLDTVGDPGVTRSYRVEAVGSNPACRSAVSNCESGPVGPRLQKNAHRLVEPAPNTNGNGVLDPGETVELPVTLFNGGQATAVNVTGRLRTVDPAQGRVVVPVVAWPDLAADTGLESAAPHFALTLLNDGIVCGDSVELELEMDADGAATRTARFGFQLGEKNRDYHVQESSPMSRFDTSPILSTFDVTDATTIGELDISVDVNHTIPGDLIVELSSPMGTTVRLHDQTPGTGGIVTTYDTLTSPDGPGTMADFAGESTVGTWTLSVQNTVFGGGSGNFNNWTLHVTSAGAFGCSELVCAEPTPTLPVNGLTLDKSGADLSFGWATAAGVAGYHVLQSTTAAFDSNVDLTGTAVGTTLGLPGGASGPGVTYYQVRSINACHQESP